MKNLFENSGLEIKEREEKPIFKAILMRHEEPFYENVGHDLTDKGVENSIQTGLAIKNAGFFSQSDPLFLFHSPKPRAEGTLDFVARSAELPTKNKRVIKQITESPVKDYETFMTRIEELDYDPESIARDHYEHPMFETRPDIIEPHSRTKKRLYRAVEYVLRSILGNEDQNSTPQILAVSHFEIITDLLDDVFNIKELGTYNSPSFGEQVEIQGYSIPNSKNVILEVNFRGNKKKVIFNREKRSIEQV